MVRQRCNPAKRARRASVLIDVIVATVVMGVALAVLISMVGRAINSQGQGERLQIAAMLLDEQLNLVLARGPDDYEGGYDVEGACDPPFQAYRYRLDFSGGTGGEPYRVVATVSWAEGGRMRSESVETRIAPRLGDEPDPERRPASPVEREFQ